MSVQVEKLEKNMAKLTAIIGRNQEKLLKVVNKLTEDALNEYGKDVIVKGYSCNEIGRASCRERV